jgi:hypothetical protein
MYRMTRTENEPLTLRLADAHDAPGLERLAALDSSREPRLPVLVAEVGGELRAALSLTDDHVVADPFRPTGDLVALLRERAHMTLRAPERRSRLRGLRAPRLAAAR